MTALDVVQSIFAEARKETERAPKYGFSDASGCRRQRVYAFREWDRTGQPAEFEKPLRWRLETVASSAWAELLESAARKLGHSTQIAVVLADPDLVITGTADLLTKDGKWVFDFKAKSDAGWRACAKAPDPGEVRQVGAYGYCLGAEHWGLIILRKRSKGEVPEARLFTGAVTSVHAEAVRQFWREVDGHRKAGTLPPQDFMPDSAECKLFCRFNKECWQ